MSTADLAIVVSIIALVVSVLTLVLVTRHD